MRGQQEQNVSLFSYIPIEERIPGKHPLRRIGSLANEILKRLHTRFAELYASAGRPSIPPEQLLLALLPQAIDGELRTDLHGLMRYGFSRVKHQMASPSTISIFAPFEFFTDQEAARVDSERCPLEENPGLNPVRRL